MLAFQWLNRFVTQCRSRFASRLCGRPITQAATMAEDAWGATARKERRLKLMRLEQRRVLNADFTFAANSSLNLSNVDGDLVVREVGNHIQFDLAGSSWNHLGGNGSFAIDNSDANHSVLSIDRSELGGLNAGISISADPNGAYRLTLETQNAAIDLQTAAGPVAIRDFETVQQVGFYDLLVQDFSITARSTIELQHLRGDDLAFAATEIDFNGGLRSVVGNTLSISAGPCSAIELGGSIDHANVLDFTNADIGALAGGFHSLSFATHDDQIREDSAIGSITVLSSGADFREALTPADRVNESSTDVGHLQLSADTVLVDGELTSAGGVVEVSATHNATISHRGGIVNHGGEILIDAGANGTLLVSGHLDASSVGSHDAGFGAGVGGRIHLLGEQVGLVGGARIDASGDYSGGEVLIGGDLHGGNEAIHHAVRTYVGSDVEINVDARLHGDGGKAVVWSDEVSQVYGLLTARGGALSGDGGLIETSSRGQLLLSGGGDASAANGAAGTWLLDPLDVGIVHQLTLFPTIIEFNELPDFAPSVSGSEVTDDAIEAQLNMGTNVVITTENLNYSEAGNVTQAADATIDVTFIADGDTATLTIIAANDIELNGGITATNGALSVVLNANAITNNDDLDLATGSVTITAAVELNGGSFESTGVNFNSTNTEIIAAGGVTITHTGSVDLGQIDSGAGTGGTLLLSGASAHGEIKVGEGDVTINGGNTDTVVFGDISASASAIISANRDVIISEAKITVTGPMSDLTMTADADSDGSGGFWLVEEVGGDDAQLTASHNITIIGSELVATTDRNGGIRIDGDEANQQVIAANDLSLLSNFDAASTTGDIVIEGVQEATSGSLTVFAKGQIFLGADQTAGDDVFFKSAVQLTNNVTVTATSDVVFDRTIDENPDATGSALTVTTSSPGAGVLFVGAIGADFVNGGPIDSLNVNGVGFVDFLNTVAVEGDINVTTTSSVDRITFQSAVTTSGNVTITNAGLLVTSSNATFELGGSFTQNGDGSTELGADITTEGGDISFAQAVLLTSTRDESVTIGISSNDGNITFSSTIDSKVVPLALLDGVLVPISQVGGEVVDVRPEHNSLVLNAGSGTIRFDGDIGAGFLDVGVPSDGNQMLGVGADGDQMLGALIVESAIRIEIGAVSMIAVDGEINFGSASEITDGIEITGLSDPGVLTIQSRFGEIHGDVHRSDSRSISINGPVATQVDLVILAADGVTLTDAADFTTNDHNIVINGDANQDMTGDLTMGPETFIDAGSGYIDIKANNVTLGALISTSSNSTYEDHPAIRVEATTGSINDGDGPLTDITANTAGSGVVLIAVTGIGSGNALETDLASLSAYNHDIVEEQQTITLENVIGGTFTISWQPPDSLPEETTQPIRFNATATEIREALLSFDSLSADDIDVTSVGGGQFVLTFRGLYRGVDVDDIAVSDADLVGTSEVATVGTEAFIASTTTTPLKAADGNIEIDDVGTTTGRVDLIFIHNEANQTEPQFAISSQSFEGTFPAAIPGDPPPPPVDVQFEFFAVRPGPESNDIVINFTSSPHTGNALGIPVITVTGHTIDIALDANGTAANTLRNAINANERANQLIHARIVSPGDTVASNIADNAAGTSIELDDASSQTGVIDIKVEYGDLTVVDDNSRPLYLDMREGLDPGGDRAIAAVQSENTIRLEANTITILDDLLAIQDSAPDDQMIGERIEIYARQDFVLGNDRVITTDENYVSSISEDRNGNGVLDTNEDLNRNGRLDSGEDKNRNGVLDAGEDVDGDGVLDFNRNIKPGTFADDPNRDQITIIADSDFDPESGVPRDGSVLLGKNSTISTDSGIEQQISPRPVLTPNSLQPFLYQSDTAFFSGEVVVSNLDTNGELNGQPLYIGSLTFTIGVAGEKNLILDIDWGDLTPPYRDNLVYPTQLADGSFRFDRVTDRTATRFLIPEGGHTYVISHEYTQNALNLKTNEGVDTAQPGRTLTTDPMQIRFAVSQHSSIRIEGQSVLNPDGTKDVEPDGTPNDVPQNHPYDDTTEPVDLNHTGRYLLSSTDVSDDPTAFLPRFDNGIAAFTIPTSKSVSFFIPPDPVIVPIETPKLITTETTIVPPSQLTTETTVIAGSTSTVTTTEYFELRRFNDDGTVEIERLNDFQGDGLLDKERFEKFISDKGDGEYEIWFITRENSSGTMIERPVIHFRLEGGHLAPPPNDSPLLFKPFKLIPLPAVPKPANNAGEAADDLDTEADDDQQPKLELQNGGSDAASTQTERSTAFDNRSVDEHVSDEIVSVDLGTKVASTSLSEPLPSGAAALAAGVTLFTGLHRWDRRSNKSSSSPFSRSARFVRKVSEY